jgi:dCMP deaminase
MASRPSWDEVWLSLADTMAKRSRCPTGAGAVIVDQNQRVVSTGYSGPPAGYQYERRDLYPSHTCEVYCLRSRRATSERDSAYLDCPASHAEANAVATGDRSRMEGGTLYVSSVPCWGCAKLLANCGVSRVVWRQGAADSYRDPRQVTEFLNRCGLKVWSV